MSEVSELIAVLESDLPNQSISVSGRRRHVILQALQLTDALRTPDTISLLVPISYQRLADLMSTFFESGDPVTSAWFRGAKFHPGDRDKLSRKTPLCEQPEFWQGDFSIHLQCEKPVPEDSGERVLTIVDLQRGLFLLATQGDGTRENVYAHHFCDILQDNIDASTADIFMQMVVYGTEVFA
jgi:hypothetical protein